MDKDKNVLKLEMEITNLIQKDNGNAVHFEYVKTLDSANNKLLLKEFKEPNVEHVVMAFTTNKNTQEQFLLKSVQALSIEEALKTILDYVRRQHEFGTFTITWSKRGSSGTTNRSDFYCHDIVDAIGKFFTGKDVKDYIIYEVKSNPIS